MSEAAEPAPGLVSRYAWLWAFALAMGWFEAAVVVYVRELYYPGGFRFPVAPMPSRVALVDVVREACTIVMLLAPATLVRRHPMDRLQRLCLGGNPKTDG